MKILIIGSGGREHAIAWKLAQSPHHPELIISSGNPGMADLGKIVPIPFQDFKGITDLAIQEKVDLAVIGPEAPLSAGLTDQLREAGIRVFGPTSAAAQIESSKAFAKGFMARHSIPTAAYQVFSDYPTALEWLENTGPRTVIKASGLASGKGVILPASMDEARSALKVILVDRIFGQAGSQVVIEERLEGEEVSLLAFTDGKTICSMPPAQDHKRLLDSDRGPNTGGMGAYAPAPVCPPELVAKLEHEVLQPAIDGLRAEGMPFVGVLYAGLILTPQGPRVLEFNARFGDPETQAILPLLETDLVDVLFACTEGQLSKLDVQWKQGACACVVLASQGYPSSSHATRPLTAGEDGTSGVVIEGLDQPLHEGTAIFHAGTGTHGRQIVTNGGRVLGVTAWAADLPAALNKAYAAIDKVHFTGMLYRKDIGKRALDRLARQPAVIDAYAQAGVNIESGTQAVELMSANVRSTYTPAVLAGIGSFAGLFDASQLASMQHPVLVASTDGVGTKVKLAAQAHRYALIGEDIVNHCINDILVQGARPLFFLDYVAFPKVNPHVAADIVSGVANACRAANCVLIGGETAEMPGVYQVGALDVAGTIVGVVEKDRILPRQDLVPGDLIIGFRSSGPHTNGYTLIRKVFEGIPLETVFPELGQSLAEVLLQPHRSYLPLIGPLLDNHPDTIKALVHLTGGSFIENIPRVLPGTLDAHIKMGSWPVPPLYPLIQSRGQVDPTIMARVFNLGIGMLAIISPKDVQAIQQAAGEETWVIGELIRGSQKVILG